MNTGSTTLDSRKQHLLAPAPANPFLKEELERKANVINVVDSQSENQLRLDDSDELDADIELDFAEEDLIFKDIPKKKEKPITDQPDLLQIEKPTSSVVEIEDVNEIGDCEITSENMRSD